MQRATSLVPNPHNSAVLSMIRAATPVVIPGSTRNPACIRPSHAATPRPGILQVSPLADFADYRGAELWDLLGEGDRLGLAREPRDRASVCAVRVYWKGNLLGTLPPPESASVARLLGQGARVGAWIASLGRTDDAQLRVEVAVELQD